MDWKDVVGGMFGVADRKFCSHHLEEERAENILSACVENGVPLQEVLDVCREFLKAKVSNEKHIEVQLEAVRMKFGKHLH